MLASVMFAQDPIAKSRGCWRVTPIHNNYSARLGKSLAHALKEVLDLIGNSHMINDRL